MVIVGCSMVFYLLFGVAIDLSYLGFRASFKNLRSQSERNGIIFLL